MNEKTRTLVGTGILTAIVVVLQAMSAPIRFGPFSVTLVLIPIVVGAALYGFKSGAWLGAVFGVVVLMTDAAAFLAVNVPGTIVTCILKGALAGLAAGLVYKALMKVNPLVATFVSAAVAPIANTGLFILGALTMSDTLGANFVADGTTVIYFLVIGCAGLNFIFEFILNMVVAPALNVVMMHLGLVPKNREDK